MFRLIEQLMVQGTLYRMYTSIKWWNWTGDILNMFEYKRRYVKCVMVHSHPNIQIKKLNESCGMSQYTNYGVWVWSAMNLKGRMEREKLKQCTLHPKYIS